MDLPIVLRSACDRIPLTKRNKQRDDRPATQLNLEKVDLLSD